ncbi:MAG TPA: hypothetical protein VGE59_00775, partial [Patescibacteria group bacterium]
VNPINTTVSPPVKPRNLTVTNDGTNLLSLRWDSSYGATEYSVFRSPTNNLAGAEQVGTNVATSRATDTLSINDHSTYYYWVRAYKPNAIVGSEAEGPVSITLNATLRTPRFYRVQELSGKKIRLEWETYLEMNGTRANDSWEIWRKEDGASEFTKVYEGMSNTTSKWTDTLPKAKTRYYYKMRAYKTIRGERLYSDFSNETSAKS